MWIHPVDTEIFGDIVLLYLVVGNDNILIEHPVQKDQKYQNTKNNSNPFSQSTFFAKVEKKPFGLYFFKKILCTSTPVFTAGITQWKVKQFSRIFFLFLMNKYKGKK